MRITLRLLGQEVFHVDTDHDKPDTGRGDCTTNPVGFGNPEDLPIRRDLT